jgi:DNA-binding NarL/FixJ family response regulator
MNEVISLLLVDDHAVVREGLRVVLENYADIQVLAEASNAQAALALVRTLKPAVILTDLRMPGLAVVELIRLMRAEGLQSQVVIFSSFSEPVQIQQVLRAGAISYLTKDALADELHQAVLAANQRVPYFSPAVKAILQQAQAPAEIDLIEKLAPRERDVLRLIAQAKSNKEIARQLGLTEGTTKGYVSAIFEKLELGDRTEAALLATRCGWV